MPSRNTTKESWRKMEKEIADTIEAIKLLMEKQDVPPIASPMRTDEDVVEALRLGMIGVEKYTDIELLIAFKEREAWYIYGDYWREMFTRYREKGTNPTLETT